MFSYYTSSRNCKEINDGNNTNRYIKQPRTLSTNHSQVFPLNLYPSQEPVHYNMNAIQRQSYIQTSTNVAKSDDKYYAPMDSSMHLLNVKKHAIGIKNVNHHSLNNGSKRVSNNDVRQHLRRARSSGYVAPKKTNL